MPPGYDTLAARNEIDEGLRFEQHGVLDTALMHYERAAYASHDLAMTNF